MAFSPSKLESIVEIVNSERLSLKDDLRCVVLTDYVRKEFLNTSLDDLVEMLVPVYSKYMTQGDLEKLIEFYQTPVGKKYAKSTPMITQESMQVGQQWGMKIGQEFEKKMKEKGYWAAWL